jgi:hypothetical protein
MRRYYHMHMRSYTWAARPEAPQELAARVSLAAYRGPGFGQTLCLTQYIHKAGLPRDQHAQATTLVVLQYHLTCRVRA